MTCPGPVGKLERNQRLVSLRMQGMSYQTIAMHAGLAPQRAEFIIKRELARTRPPKETLIGRPHGRR